ncbi:putative Chromosome partition protein Smc [Candidatus Competibacter denitrificans Run_A_D11]|uniref:Chromosome partition protein Smc n=1 Tax=Candidatus Competibacter denitrificans Run_A_D11 TaxID=1400863 RepID=W6M716_9GAMM|nr:chromosome segregation protein SMC [Candidatus Competibacter denitrificans]CDI02409.1 putative Chromosome partition protein Smc [Candidatus Competibacter denitrificans Run_A_D11]HAS87433.1 chromosome segregation protein SMC [Candidatus Competibacteraceae bacterium]HRC69787.1 chromosome segregation protein SMC [Candidatus Competibacter denitrificans]
MRLSKIKLAGFKSFVDPTVLHLPSNLVAVVGPNGCGKSNIIDAVRWVMGESSARSLRGETMSDVIFNGAATRKPVGLATVELVFDNEQGRLGGSWASYAEIAVKRSVGRDGQSNYFLNGTRCRRRDIADLFLGTGLGPRSYAIAEQGMISRVIEARPEDLRVFLEEAAGISKYKERRRETETRIRHTRENLDRLNDVREELNRQLQHVERQARAATHYREHRAEERRLQAELAALRWQQLHVICQADEQALRQQETQLEAILAAQRHREVTLEKGRIERATLNETYHEAQGRYYRVGAEISRLENYLEHQRERQRRREDERAQTALALEQIAAQLRQDQTQKDQWAQALSAAELALEHALAAEVALAEMLATTEPTVRAADMAWHEHSQRTGAAERQIEVERTRIQHLERQLLQDEQRLARLRHEQGRWSATDLDGEQADLQAREGDCTERLQRDETSLGEIIAALSVLRDSLTEAELGIGLAREHAQTGRARLISLQTLQEAALSRNAGECNDWLREHGLEKALRLAECLEVEPGWEAAAESVLADWLDAICVTDLAGIIAMPADVPHGHLTLFEPTGPQAIDTSLAGLAGKIHAPWSLTDFLDGVMTATDLAEALAQRSRLNGNESVVTPDGLLCGRHWLRMPPGEDTGILRREREIRQLETELQATEATLTEQSSHAETLRARLAALETRRRAVRDAVNQQQRELASLQGQLQAAHARWAQARERNAALLAEQAANEEQYQQAHEDLQIARLRLEEALATQVSLRMMQTELAAARHRSSSEIQQQRVQIEAAHREVTHQTVTIETLRARLAGADLAIERLDTQRQQLIARHSHLQEELAGETDGTLAAAEEELAGWLETQIAAETALQAARRELEIHDAALEAGEKARGEHERQATAQRRLIEERRLATTEARIHQQNLREQLRQLAADPETVLANLPAEITESAWLARLDQVARRIQRLGPINLAAMEECAQLSERKKYLDTQNEDLCEALSVLDNAIRKIDRETRARFRETFDQVNISLQDLFPRLFGGGQGYLALTGEDTLDAGVTIMAKPPGKRIGSISLLSGGEKALTAIALVFAIFQLNPAPFCLLDEVDAPLDEANVGRFGALVGEMAARVQFIFVTHNKATMEIAQHLAGVTMQEPGVSRLVAVDVEEALRLAAVG